MFESAPGTTKAMIEAAREAAISNPVAAYALAVLALACVARKVADWI